MRFIVLCFALFASMSAFAFAAPQAVRFRSGEATLAGAFYPAAGSGKHLTIVLLAGSGNEPRDTVPFNTLERVFNAAGFNVFAFDKRGVGESSGKYDDNAPLGAFAADALAAVQAIEKRPDVDASRLGVWGISQGGSIGPLMATKSRDVRFVISVSGPGMSAAEQGIYFRAGQMIDGGASSAEAAQMQALRRVLWAYYGTGLGAQAAQTALDIAKNSAWSKALQMPATLSTPAQLDPNLRAFMQQAAMYDPLATAGAVRVPILYVFGAKDGVVQPDLSLENLITASARGGSTKATFLLFPNAGHGLEVVTADRECHACMEKQMMQTGKWNAAPGFFDAMIAWLKQL